MKRLLIFSFLSALMLTAWALIHSVNAQTPTPYLGAASRLLFDHSGLDANGKPETLKDCEFGLTSPLVADLNQQPTPTLQHGATAPVVAGPNSIVLAGVIAAATEGQYKLWLRVRDARGNATQWAGGILVEIDNTPPSLPANIRVLIDGTALLEINGDDVLIGFAGKVAK